MINLGSPDSPTPGDVRTYLEEFLTDPRVIDVPFVRKVIVPLIILNTRPKKSAEAYASIWTGEGSPLVATSRKQVELAAPNSPLPIFLAMRYGNPSIPDVLGEMVQKGIKEVFVIPLYPHYAMSSYETVVVKVTEELAKLPDAPKATFLQPFYNHPEYLHALTASIRPHLPETYDRILFSFHGIPERHLRLSDPSRAHCLCVPDCCHNPNPAHATCYRHQCLMTAEAVAENLEIPHGKWLMTFQSRLGRDPWLAPPTDRTLDTLARDEGVKSVRVVCPAFVTDCLETIEEIAEEAREIFLDAGGEDFALIPCLNEHPLWIEFLVNRINEWNSEPVPA